MSALVDISAERCGLIAGSVNEATFELILALRAALDKAEAKVDCCRASNTGYVAENDALRAELDAALRQNRMLCAEMRSECADASATGYARGEADGIRKAAGVVQCGCRNKTPFNPDGECACPENCSEEDVAAILALLPATDAPKETRDDQ